MYNSCDFPVTPVTSAGAGSRSCSSVSSRSDSSSGCSSGCSSGALTGSCNSSGMRINISVTDGVRDNSESESVRELRLKLQDSQEECSKLQSAVVELTQVNKRWQRYNNDRQLYVQRLLNTIQDQQEQLNHIGEHQLSTRRSSLDRNSSSSLGDDTAEGGQLKSEEKKLREKVSILEFQVKAHRDDWEAELSEKKQVLKDKEALERKVAILQFQLSGVHEGADCRVDLFCQNCGRVVQFVCTPPSPSRMYRTAVHLPCSSSRQSSSTSISTTGDELVIDSCGGDGKQPDCGGSLGLNLPVEDSSCYSRSSTLPLCEATPKALPTVKSYVQIPVAKSSSLPEGGASKFPELHRTSFKSVHVPPVTAVNSDQYEGVHTFSAEDVICLRCGEVFPPSKHLEFLDHFPNCKTRCKSVNLEGQ